VARAEIEPLELGSIGLAEVLVIVGRTDRSITLNLKAPLLVNLSKRIGRQVLTNGDLPIRYELGGGQVTWKKIA
jgi:flagellar assembly factor FliW